MAELRTGVYGEYYGSPYNSSIGLTYTQMLVNATYIYKYLTNKGWTINAIAGLLGNMQAESSLNPGRWQSEYVGNTSGGYGLVQWTPATKYFNYCTDHGLSDPSEMDNNLLRIIYELEHGLQWIATDEYDLTFEEFSKSQQPVEYLASAFLKNYERAGVEVEDQRRVNAVEWLAFLTDSDIDVNPPGVNPTKKNKKRFNFIIFNRQRRYF